MRLGETDIDYYTGDAAVRASSRLGEHLGEERA
jgi:hypothetical protein